MDTKFCSPRDKGTFVAPLSLSRGATILRGRIKLDIPSDEIGGVSFPKQNRVQRLPNLCVPPMFAEDVSRVVLPIEVMKTYHTRCNRLSGVVVGQSVVTLT